MVAGGRDAKRAKKQAYFDRVVELFQTYSKVILVQADNVGSNQMQMIRAALRGEATLLMGKNSMIRRAMRSIAEENPKIDDLLPYIVGNVGLVFTNENAADVRSKIAANRVGAPAKAGAIAPCDVDVPPGPTGMEPGMTSFFQALNIATKIARGQIEIVNPVALIKIGDKVTASQAVLLAKLGIFPFSYGLEATYIYDDGTIFNADVLDLTAEDIGAMISDAARDIGALSLAIDYPTIVSVPHSILNGFKNIMMISLATDYTIKEIAELKELLDNPEALAAAQAAAAAAAPAAGAGGDAGAAAADDGDDSSSSMGGDMFDMFG